MSPSEEDQSEETFHCDILHHDMHVKGININVTESSMKNLILSYDKVSDLTPSQLESIPKLMNNNDTSSSQHVSRRMQALEYLGTSSRGRLCKFSRMLKGSI